MVKPSPRRPPARLPLAACLLTLALMLAPLPVRAAWPFFEIANSGLTGYAYAAAAWGDVDGDGDLDIVIAGRPYGSGTGHTTRVYLNDGHGTFAASEIALPGYSSGAAAWGDYDGDGDLDLALSGQTDAGRATKVYRNTGATLEDSGATLVGVDEGSLAWGDADGDGDLDLLVTGCPDGTCSTPVSVIYPNQGGTFGEAVALPVQVGHSDAAWGDYDNDGDLDIAITGQLAGGGYATRILRNQGGLSIVDSGIRFFYDVSNAALAWADFDRDGDLDLLLSGYNGSLGDYYCVYRNRGPTDFYLAGTSFGAKGGSAAWGDYSNDGLPDFALTGIRGEGTPRVSSVYRNNGDDSFSDISAELIAVSDGTALWGDADGDGDLDLLVVGHGATDVAKLYRNDSPTTNQPPTPPSGLRATVAGNRVTLSWTASTDDHSAIASLTYNLRVGTTPGGGDVLPPLADSSGRRRVPALGNAGHGLSAVLDLSAGTYYWSVQAVDSAYVGGPFASEGTFTICAPPEAVMLEGPSEGAAGAEHTFTATVSPLTATSPITYTWESAGEVITTTGGTSSTAGLVWASPGVHPITVTARNACGVVSATASITICQPPEVSFSAEPTSGPAPLAVSFTSRITGEVTSRLWDFGDGTTSTGEAPVNLYLHPGVYTVTLTVTGTCGTASLTRSELIHVWIQPPESLTLEGPTTARVGTLASFTATVSPATTSTPITYTWQRDEEPPEVRAPSFSRTSLLELSWDLPGLHAVTVTAQNAAGVVTATQQVTVCDRLDPDFVAEPASGAAPLEVTFTNLTAGATALLWDFGDGATSTVTNPVHTYAQPGSYTVTLTVANACGEEVCVVPECVTVLCGALEGLTLDGPATGAVGETYAFTASVSPPGAALPVTYEWEVEGHGVLTRTEGVSDVLRLAWPSPGRYGLQVSATNACGAAVSATHTITICWPLTAAFVATPTVGVAPLEVLFFDASSNHDWRLWDLGDGSSSAKATLQHRYESPGIYTVTLTVGNAGRLATATGEITVSAPARWYVYLPMVVRSP